MPEIGEDSHHCMHALRFSAPNSVECAKLLMRYGASPDAQDMREYTPASVCQYANVELVTLLTDGKGVPNRPAHDLKRKNISGDSLQLGTSNDFPQKKSRPGHFGLLPTTPFLDIAPETTGKCPPHQYATLSDKKAICNKCSIIISL